MKALRDPEQGCPWDVEQTPRSILPFTLEESYELADAIERDDVDGVREELGDLLFHVVFHARMAEERGDFGFLDVVEAVSDKLERRHPHVFAGEPAGSAREVSLAWERRKREERGPGGLLDDVPAGLPALGRAWKLQKRAASVGFDWPETAPVLAKLKEEIGELEQVLASPEAPARIEDEIGDVLFAAVNLARHAGIDPELALRGANRKFQRRFARVERELRDRGISPVEASLEEMDRLWDAAKADEEA